MKFELRNQAPSHILSSTDVAVRPRTRMSTTVVSAAIAAIVSSVSACSSADDAAVIEPATASSEMTESAAVVASVENDIHRETPAPESDVSEPSIAREASSSASEAPRATSPRGGSTTEAAPEPRTISAPEPASAEQPAPARVAMQVAGRQLLDTCGKPFVTRGVEQIFGDQLPQGNDWTGLLQEITDSGVNAVRILAGTDTLGVSDVDALLDIVADRGLVGYVSPIGDEGMSWLARPEVRSMLAKHEKYIIIDAFGEPTFDDRDRFLADSTDAIRQVRSWGYRVPLTVTANQFGRDLPSLFELGPKIVAADPLGNTILGWQAYWGSNGYYSEHYGMSFEQALDAIEQAPFPIQLGLDRVTDYPSSETADFGTLMAGTQARGVGWLWWDWYNPYGNENSLTQDGSVDRLTATGATVLETHAASVQNTAKRVCVR